MLGPSRSPISERVTIFDHDLVEDKEVDAVETVVQPTS
jgi:hypothetical protein